MNWKPENHEAITIDVSFSAFFRSGFLVFYLSLSLDLPLPLLFCIFVSYYINSK